MSLDDGWIGGARETESNKHQDVQVAMAHGIDVHAAVGFARELDVGRGA